MWAQEVSWPLDYPSTSLSEIGITTSSEGVELNANGGWYYMLNQSGYYANLSNTHTLVTSGDNACPVFFDTNTGWAGEVNLKTAEGFVYGNFTSSNTWTTNTNGGQTAANRNWAYTLSNGKYKLNNTGKHKTDGKYLAPNAAGAGQTIFADKTNYTEWSLIPAYKVELIDKLNSTYNTYISGSSSEKAPILQTALEAIYSDLTDATVTTEEAYNSYVTRINGALAVYDANLLIVNRDFEAATWDLGWNGTGSTKKSQFVKQTNSQFTGNFAEMWDGTALTANDLNQTVKALPAGIYSLSAKAIAQNIDATLYAKIGDVQKSITFRSDAASTQTVWFKLDETSDVQIGFKQNAGGSSGSKWVAVDDFSLTYATELPDAADITNFIKNNSFEVNGTEGWTVTGTMGAGPNDNIGGKDGSVYIEAYEPNGDRGVEQTISNLVPGLYEVTVLGRARNMQEAQVYATAGSTTNRTMFTNNVTDNYSVVIDLHQGESLTFGAKCTNTATDGRWFALDNFRLVYRPTLAVVEGKMNADVQSAMASAVPTYNDNKTVENYNAAKPTIAAANASVKQYEDVKTALDAQKDLMDNSNLFTEAALTTYNTNYTTLLGKYNDNTLTNTDGVVNPAVATGWRAKPVDAADLIMSQWSETNYTWDSYHANTWSTEGNSDGSNFRVPFVEYWTADASSLAAKTITTKEIDVENGVYSLTAWVRVRAKNETAATDATGITLQVNEGEVVDVTNGTQIGTGLFTIAEVTAYGEVTNGKLVVKFNVAEDNNISWLAFKNIKYTKTDLATNEQVEEFKQALQDANAKTIGFEDGEYAPYNNVAAIAALKAAKEIDVDAPIETAVLTPAKDALDNATWTANDGEVNAVYDGTFANATNNGAPAGWTMSNNTLGGELHSRAFVGDSRLSEFNESKSAFFVRFDGNNSDRGSMYYYGKTDGYNIPLKSATQYYLSIDVKNWGAATNKPLKVFVTNPSGNSVKDLQINTASDADTNDDAPQNIAFVFTANEDGNYVINFQCPGSDDNKHNVVVSNIELKKATSASMAINATAKYGTFVAPFDVTIPDGVTASTADVDGEVVKLTALETTIPANTPVIVNAEDGLSKTTFYGKAIDGGDAPTEGCLVGNVTSAPVSVPLGAYLLQMQEGVVAFYIVEDAKTVGVNRAYMKEQSNPVKAFMIGDEETGIKAATLDELFNGKQTIYDMSGRRVEKAQKGIYIINGKKVVR